MSLAKIREWKKKGFKVGFTCSTFELLHPGHIAMLNDAKEACDYLVVGLLTDPTISRPTTKNKPVESTFERWMRIQAIDCVDIVIPFDTEKDLEDLIEIIKPDIRMVGDEYESSSFTAKHYCPIEFNTMYGKYSSTNLKKRIKDANLHV